ncbi:hypothetical protein BX611_1533 [Lutibacter oceani]|uniref:Uncharacterized protein n=1 Tax=Lutibacter oceani TaxID=1853311 RepID=A0A3D9RQ09_9FLAO|nr:hypothetical protein [Lutibacter oceani]REE81990.1 hypothetical protein BX611_1533 [Lutibacter oceani]
MKQFIKKSSLFIFLCALSIGLTSSLFNNYIGEKASFKLPKNVKNVVFGHSHPEVAFNDSLIANFKNLAQSGESYFYTYLKAKLVLNQNPQIKNIFIEFSNIDVTKNRDLEIWNDKYINWRYPIYAALMNTNERFFLATKNPSKFLNTLPKTFKKQLKRIHTGQYNYELKTSGYLFIKESKLDSLLSVNTNNIIPKLDYYKASTYNILYLEKLVSLCKSKNLNIYFIRSPLYKDSYFLSNNKLFYKIKSEKFSNITFIDFVDFPLENNEYRDFHHLNNKGARKFSLWFNDWLYKNINYKN